VREIELEASEVSESGPEVGEGEVGEAGEIEKAVDVFFPLEEYVRGDESLEPIKVIML
jgi:hypothetical protein